jgi:tetratricopeptide (TPR) repeat protein
MNTLFVVGGHLLVTVVYLVLRVRLLGRVGQEPVQLIETLWAVADAPWLLLQYAKLCLMPFGHAPDYGNSVPLVRITAIYGVVGIALFAWLNWKGSRGVRYGAWLYVVSLAPVMHIVPLWTLMADRFALVPSVGLVMVVAGLVSRAEPRLRPLVIGASLLLGIMWAGASAIEARRFRSDEAFFAFGVEEVPQSGLAHHNLGLTLLKKGELDRAIEHLTLADKLGRRDPRMYHHLAGALEAKGQLDDAARAIDIAIRLKPDFGNAYAQRAAIQRRKGDLDGAEASLAEAKQHDVSPRAYDREMAALLVSRGKIDDARKLYRKMAEMDEPDPLPWQHVAECAEVLGNLDEARDAVEHCLKIDPRREPCLAIQARHAQP